MRGPVDRIRLRRRRRESEEARQRWLRNPSEENRTAMMGAFLREGQVKYRRLLKKLADR